MSNVQQSFNAGQTQGKTQSKAEGMIQSAKEGTANAANSAQATAQRGADQSAGFMQQTGEQMKSMAQGAVDGVKNTLGMGDKK
ncbi:late embryogenesis abundant protein 2 [Punica granatum]|uniref:Uncharacterized protein n=2 Tax=Punica granatum TaxID=22663 RepID=A0A218XHP3_PUNGR|nr:late embryogenesis abundant protein 2 [Punica granatum]OWM84246.1 hypothetical protein CDL15_Pgr011631 [Punica granatum]PKI61169.1 hypothetical protein CRG98_018489 [Punica granatum]